MIEINSYGGRIGRFWWINSSMGGGLFDTVFNPGSCGWDHAWPETHAWPVRPWGKGDPLDEHWRDFAAFESWFQDELEKRMEKRRLDEIDLTITDKIDLYDLMVYIFHAGVMAGRDPWSWAQDLEREARQ